MHGAALLQLCYSFGGTKLSIPKYGRIQLCRREEREIVFPYKKQLKFFAPADSHGILQRHHEVETLCSVVNAMVPYKM